MKIFILDDEKIRHDMFEEGYGRTHELTHAYSVGQLKACLEKHGKPDLIFLDHDLGVGACTGVDAAKLLVEQITEEFPIVIIHSWNAIGAKNMAYILQDAGCRAIRKPFGVWVKAGMVG